MAKLSKVVGDELWKIAQGKENAIPCIIATSKSAAVIDEHMQDQHFYAIRANVVFNTYRLWNRQDSSAILRLQNHQFLLFYAHKRPSPFLYTCPTKTLFKSSRWRMLSWVQLNQQTGCITSCHLVNELINLLLTWRNTKKIWVLCWLNRSHCYW